MADVKKEVSGRINGRDLRSIRELNEPETIILLTSCLFMRMFNDAVRSTV